jgi:hypothetical protein
VGDDAIEHLIALTWEMQWPEGEMSRLAADPFLIWDTVKPSRGTPDHGEARLSRNFLLSYADEKGEDNVPEMRLTA